MLIFLSYYIILQHGKCMLSPWSLWVLLPCIGVILSNMPFSFFFFIYISTAPSMMESDNACFLEKVLHFKINQSLSHNRVTWPLTSFIGDDCDELWHWPLPFGRISQDTNGVCVIRIQICYDGTVGVRLDFLVVPQNYG